MRENLNYSIQIIMADLGDYRVQSCGEAMKWGITETLYADYVGGPSPVRESYQKQIESLTQEECYAIYKQLLWDQLSCDSIPSGIDYFVFDSAVYHSTGPVTRWLFSVTGGPRFESLRLSICAAVNEMQPNVLLDTLTRLRRQSLRSLSDWREYRQLYTNRINTAHRRALKLMELVEV